MKEKNKKRLGIVLVTYGEGDKIRPLLDIIQKEKRAGDRVALIDNHPEHVTADVAEAHPAVSAVIKSENVGFAVGCVRAAAAIENSVDLLLFLNPDSQPEAGAITKLREDGPGDWSAWMGLLVLPDGQKVNSAGNVVHISGLSWVSGFGDSVKKYDQPQEVSVVSGADFVVRTNVWKEIKGFPPIYYIYYEDTELSIDIRMMGQKVGLLPDARIRHAYSFYNSPRKWYLIERNRYVFIIRTWPLGVIIVLLPLLLLVEIGLWLVSILQRRPWLKVRSTLGAIKVLPEALAGRREVQKRNKLSSLDFFEMLEPRIDTPLLPKAMSSAPVNWFFIGYYKLAWLVLRIFSTAK